MKLGLVRHGRERDREVELARHRRVGVDDVGRAGDHTRVGLGLQDRVGRAAASPEPSATPRSQCVDRRRVAGEPEADHGAAGAGAGPVVPEDVVEQQRVAEGSARRRQRGLQQGAVRDRSTGPPEPGSPLLVTAVAVVRFFMIVLLKTRTSGASLMRDAAALVGRHVVDDHVVVDVHREVAGHQEPDPAAVVVGHVGLDQVVVDGHGAGARREGRGSAGSSPAIMIPPPSS